MWAYIFFCALYRMSSGALLLVIGWSLATARGNSADALALATFLSFVPALLVPLAFKWLPRRYTGKAASVASFACLALLSLLVARNLHAPTALVTLFFLLWLFFFVLEPLVEAWFTVLAVACTEHQVNRMSSLSMTINQCCLMVGPVLAYAVASRIGTPQLVDILAGLFGVMALLNLALMPALTEQGDGANSGITTSGATDGSDASTIIPLALIWPVVGSFNFMVPVYFAMEANGNMAKAGIVDGCMGVGMALAGLMSLNRVLAQPAWRNGLAIATIAGGAAVWQIGAGDIAGCALAAAMLGCGFGAMRIGCRTYLARHFSAPAVADLVAKANAFSLLILLTSLLICKLNFAWSWVMPFVLSLCLVAMASLFLKERRALPIPQ